MRTLFTQTMKDPMKNQAILATLTIALLTACGGSSSDNDSAAIQPTDSQQRPNSPHDSNTPITQQDNSGQTGNTSSNTPPADNGQTDNTADNTPQQNPDNNDQNPPSNNSALTIAPRSGELTGATYTLTTGILSTPVARNIRDQGNLSVGQIKLPTFAASEHKGGLLIFNNINGKEDLSYNSFQVSDNSYRYIQFGNFNFDQNDERLFFARGNETTQMPSGGSATYSGDSILNFHNKDEQYLRTETGTMNARADFAKGTLDLSVKTPSHSGSITDAHINGNGFLGADEKKTVIGGNFAGPLAEEIFGSYSHIDQDGSTVWGGFGGKRQ